MGKSKVIYGDEVLIDLTSDTVKSDNMLLGTTAHGADGDPVVGSLITHNVIDNLTSTSTVDALSANQGRVLDAKIEGLFWVGTKAEYQEQSSQIPAGTKVYITDDVGEVFTSWGNIIGDIEDQEDLMDALNSKGGGGSIVRVTFDVSQAGRTITFSMTGMETKTETVPTVSPYVIEISTMELGNLTITDTVTSRSTIVNIETYTLYSVTFIPGFILQVWLDAGGVVGTYADLNSVFADEKAVRRLMTVHASVDYLISVCETDIDNSVVTIINNDICAKWINLRDYALDTLYSNTYIASEMDTADKYFYGEWVEKDGVWQPKGNVPIMTSNSAPYGTCFGSNISSASPAYYAFDNNDNTRCETTGLNVTSGQYVGYTFVNPVKMKRAIVTTYKDQNSISQYTIKFQASNDGFVNEIVDVSDSIVVTNDVDKKKVVCNLNATKYYSSYRLYYESYTGIYAGQYYFNVVGLNFYGRELSVSVPAMTSNTAPWGEVIYSSVYNTEYIWKAFDKNESTWGTTNGSTGEYIGYKFTKPTKIRRIEVKPYNICNFDIEYFNGTTWETLEGNLSTTSQQEKITRGYSLETSAIRFKCNSVSSGGKFNIIEANIFGLDYSEREFASGSTMKYIYDHGVELEELTVNNNAIRESSVLRTKVITQATFCTFGKYGLDLSSYNLFRVKAGEFITSTADNLAGEIMVSDRNPFTWTDPIGISVKDLYTPISDPNTVFLDISSVSGSHGIGIGSGGSVGREFSVKEWWLE